MAWTYSGAPGTADASERRDAVRLAVGDTDTRDQQLTDAEIAYVLVLGANDVTDSSIEAARILMFKFARQVDNSKDGLSVSAGERYLHYKELYELLVDSSAVDDIEGGLIPYAGGQSVAEKEASAAQSDLVQPIFTIGMNDNPEAGSDSSTSGSS